MKIEHNTKESNQTKRKNNNRRIKKPIRTTNIPEYKISTKAVSTKLSIITLNVNRVGKL